MTETWPDVVERIARFVDSKGGEGDFEELALAAFAFQYERSEPFRRLCDGRGKDPGTVDDWRQIPAVPAAAYRTLELRTAPAQETFRSSGTTDGHRAVHHHPFPELYRRVIDASFPDFCLPAERVDVLSLIPSRQQIGDSSLGFMAEHILRAYGSAESLVAFSDAGVESAAATAWCRERGDRPVLVLATAFALVQWFEETEQDPRLGDGSVVFETGGFKGRVREITRGALLEQIEERLGIAPRRVVREYGMTELTSQFYTRALAGGDADVFVELPWLKARLLDPETLSDRAPGEPGLLTIFDLANLGSAVQVMTQDLGQAVDGGFRLLGRAGDADLRGCSLTVEELALTLPSRKKREKRPTGRG